MILAFCGAIHAGKDVCADYLVRVHGFRKRRFSDAIVQEVAELYHATLVAYLEERFSRGLIERLGHDALIERVLVTDRTPITRALLQDHGTARRRDRPSYWTDRVEAWLRGLPIGTDAAVTGVRYPDEVAMIRRCGGHVIKVWRPRITTEADDHEVENGLRDFTDYDAVLLNDGTVADLEARLEARYGAWRPPASASAGAAPPVQKQPGTNPPQNVT